MLQTTLRSAWSRKRRLLGTALAVVLGVAFLSATLILGDTARSGFRVAFQEANAGTDAYVRSADRFTGAEFNLTQPLPQSTVAAVAAVDGVAAAVPTVEGIAQVLDADGSPVGGGGPPTTGAAWIDDPALTGWDVVEGRPPTSAGEVVIDRAAAEDAGLQVGDTATLLVPDPVQETVVGIVAFGDKDSIGGTTYVGFTLAEAQQRLLGSTDVVTGVVAHAADGISQAELVQRLQPALAPGTEAITGAALTAEQQKDIEGDFLGVMTQGLLAFAVIALVVSAFSIFNTFSILVAQRTRESALLRALGASRKQVLGSALVESLIVGLLGAGVGVGAGILVAGGLVSLLDAVGFGLPVDGLAVTSTALITAGIAGLAVTLAAGLAPALRASRVAPLAALREVAVDSSGSSRARAIVGTLIALGGAALVLSGGSGDDGMPRAGGGALVLLVGVILLGPVMARPLGGVLAAPLRLRGTSGDLAGRNARRNPRRTSGTAAALLVGVGVVSLFTVFAASLTRSLGDEIDKAFRGDLVLEAGGSSFGGVGIAPATVDRVAQLPEVSVAAGLGYGPATIDGQDDDVTFGDPQAIATVSEFHVTQGSFDAVDDGAIAMTEGKATSHGWALGDTVDVGFVDGTHVPLRIAALYTEDMLGGDVIVSRSLWAQHGPQPTYYLAFVDLAPGVSIHAGQEAVRAATGGAGAPKVLDRDEFIDRQAGQVKALLSVVYGLLAVAILIALMGIANTLSLSVHERTRELGLLRAVGQTRRQLRSMVRWESVVVSTFGAVGGVGLGVFLGWGLVRTLKASEGLGTFAVPAGSLVAILVLGAVVGVVAALRPAWRASRLNVLDAIAET